MQISGTNRKGEIVQTSISQFSKTMKKPHETYKMGSSPTEFIYKNVTTGAERKVDLLEMSQFAGIKNAQFKFDADAMRDQGYMNKNSDIDMGAAYTIERIKTNRGRSAFLKDKGYSNVYEDGGNYFSIQNGQMSPINNKDGLDTSDFVRFVSNIGRDLGAAFGATAAVGAGAVAAIPSLGTSLGAGVATAAVAGAGGAIIGESAQRGVESMLGFDSAKYNEDMTMSEEAQEIGSSAVMGSISGAAQPLMVAGSGYAQGFLAKKFAGASSEFGKRAVAKMEGNALSARLPQGYLQKFGSSEEAKAVTEMGKQMAGDLKEASSMLGKKQISSEEMRAVTKETGEALSSGVAKQSKDEMTEESSQWASRESWKSKELEKAKEGYNKKQTQEDMFEALEQEVSMRHEKAIKDSEDYFGRIYAGGKRDLHAMFDESGDRTVAGAARNTLKKNVLAEWKRGQFKGLDYDLGDKGQVYGFTENSFQDFTKRQIESSLNNSDSFLRSYRHNAPTLDFPADPSIKKEVTDSLLGYVKGMDGEDNKEIIKNLISEIENHQIGDSKSVRKAFDDFHTSVRGNKSENLGEITEALESYENMATKSNGTVSAFYQAQKKSIEMSEILGETFQINNDELVENAIVGLKDLAEITGGSDRMENLISAFHFQKLMSKDGKSNYGRLIEADKREMFNAFNFIERLAPREARYEFKDAAAKSAENSSLFTVGFVGSIMLGNSMMDSIGSGYAATQTKGLLRSLTKNRATSALKKGSNEAYKRVGKLGSKSLSTVNKYSSEARISGTHLGTEEYLRQKRN